MNADKIVGILGLVFAVVLGFGVQVPLSHVLLLIFGVVFGFNTLAENHVRVLISAVALTIFTEHSHPSVLGAIPEVGQYLHGIAANIGTIAEGAGLMIIFRNLFDRFKS